MASNAAYDFSAAPQSVPIKRNAAAAKYRDDEENMLSAGNNIMFDSRVVRGNTYAAQVVTQEQQRQQQVYNRNEKARQVSLMCRPCSSQLPTGRVRIVGCEQLVSPLFCGFAFDLVSD